MNVLTRLLSGSPSRKTRLHDHKANRVPIGRLLRNGPRAAATGLMRVGFGSRPEAPWISYDGTQVLEAFLTSKSRVLEFGSGMSTIWYAKRAGHVVSIENYRPWYDKVVVLLKKRGIANVSYVFAGSSDEYVNIPEAAQGFDLIMVDGSIRDRCTESAIDLLRPGGIFYLDNSDRGAFPDSEEHRAERRALDYAREHGCSVTYFTDFAPTQFFAQEGMMVRRPA